MRLLDLFEAANVHELVRQFGDKITKRFKQDQSIPDDTDPEQFIQDIDQKFNPTNKHDVLQWMVKTYVDGGIRYYEDFSKVKQYLDLFFKYRNQMPVQSLHQIKSLSDFGSMVLKFEKDKEASFDERSYAKETSRVVYKGPEGLVLQPYTKGAACVYGKGTQWCISATKSDNYFNQYSFDDDVNFLFVLPKDGSKWAISMDDTGDYQIWDEQDNTIKHDTFYKKYPWVVDIVKHVDIQHPKPDHRVISSMKPHEIVALIRDGHITHDDLEGVDLTPNQQMALVNYYHNLIAFIKNPTENVQLEVVKRDSSYIKYIKNPSEKVQLEAVKQNGLVIYYINKPYEEVQLAAVRDDSDALKDIYNPSEDVQLDAVKHDGRVIRYIHNPSEDVQMAAVKQNGYAIEYIKNPSDEVQQVATNHSVYSIRYIKNPTEKVQLNAIKSNPDVFQYIEKPTPKATALAKRLGGG